MALSFTNADDFLLPGLTVSNIANPYPGFITLSGISNDLIEGTSLAGSEKIYELCFAIIESSAAASTSYLSVGSTPTPVEVISSSEGEVDIWRVDGKIQINILDCENEGNPIDPVGFSLNEVEAYSCLLYTSPSPRDLSTSRMPCSARKQCFFNDTATTEIYTLHIVGSVRCV